jgi:hypothetical protein
MIGIAYRMLGSLIKESWIPFSIVRARQLFELLSTIADVETQGVTVRVPPALIQPIAADDVIRLVAETAVAGFFQTTVGFLNASGTDAGRLLVTLLPEAPAAAASLPFTLTPLQRRTIDVNVELGIRGSRPRRSRWCSPPTSRSSRSARCGGDRPGTKATCRRGRPRPGRCGRSARALKAGRRTPRERFSVIVESLAGSGPAAAPITVECARYQSPGRRFGQGGGAALASRIR